MELNALSSLQFSKPLLGCLGNSLLAVLRQEILRNFRKLEVEIVKLLKWQVIYEYLRC